MADIGVTLRTARDQAGLSLRDLAALAGTSHATIAAYEAGRVVPRVDTVTRVLAACGVTLTPERAHPPRRDVRRAAPDREFAQALTLVEATGTRPRTAYPPWNAPVFGRQA